VTASRFRKHSSGADGLASPDQKARADPDTLENTRSTTIARADPDTLEKPGTCGDSRACLVFHPVRLAETAAPNTRRPPAFHRNHLKRD
jgi:hypothetical protein